MNINISTGYITESKGKLTQAGAFKVSPETVRQFSHDIIQQLVEAESINRMKNKK